MNEKISYKILEEQRKKGVISEEEFNKLKLDLKFDKLLFDTSKDNIKINPLYIFSAGKKLTEIVKLTIWYILLLPILIFIYIGLVQSNNLILGYILLILYQLLYFVIILVKIYKSGSNLQNAIVLNFQGEEVSLKLVEAKKLNNEFNEVINVTDYCPGCGNKLGTENICENCGLNLE
jgi:hypothetical protein